MIPIVVHGILGTTYGQNVVVDEEVRENGSLQVLYDIRRQLSMQYGDDTPMTSWALQPAPTGMWLTHIERAFDINYAPGYIAFSFLIPHGRQPKSTVMLKLIKNTLNQNHSKYIQQGVTRNISDWSFLKELSADLEAYMTHTDVAAPVTQPSAKYGIAYSEGDAATLLDNLWDSRVAQCRMVFCGREILTADKEFVAIEDVLPMADNTVGQAHPSVDKTAIDHTTLVPPEKQNVTATPARNDSFPNETDTLHRQDNPLVGRNNKNKENGTKADKSVHFNRKGLLLTIVGMAIVILVVAVLWKPTKQDMALKDGAETDSVMPEVITVDTVMTEDVPTKKDSVKQDLDKIDMGFTSENGKRLYWAVGNMTSKYTIAETRSKKGALFYWGDTSYTSTGDFRDRHYDDWYDQGGWKKSSLFAGPNPPACISGTKNDVAHVKLGDNWRLPTRQEFQDLIKNSTIRKATENGQKGYLFTSKINGNTLFFPRTDSWQGDDVGSYWSGTRVEADRREAYYIFMNRSTAYMARLLRCDANSIRPVCEE